MDRKFLSVPAGSCRRACSNASRQSGVALVVVLLVTALLVSLVTHFTYGSRVELALSGHALDALRVHGLLLSAYRLGTQVLVHDDNDYDAPTDLWGRSDLLPLGMSMLSESARVSGQITDESSKLDVNLLVDDRGKETGLLQKDMLERLTRLFDYLELDTGPIDSLMDWMDPDDLPRSGGAESSYYEGLSTPYACGNGRLETLNQLLLVRGWTREMLFGTEKKPGLAAFLTVHSDRRGKVNINTAPKEVLISLDERMDEQTVGEILAYRASEPFEKTADLKEVPAIDQTLYSRLLGKITAESSYFALRMTAEQGTARMRLHAVVRRTGGKVEPVYWRAG